MQKIKIACTSSGCLSKEDLSRYNIDIIPILVEFQNQEYQEGVSISQEDFFSLLEKNPGVLPKTHMPPTKIIESVFSQAVLENYSDIIVIGISSGLGGTCSKIEMVADYFRDKINIYVFDSKITGFHEGVLAMTAASLVQQGKNTKEIIQHLFKIRKNSYLYGACSSLEYLIGNGRLKGAQAFFGKALNICPSLEMNQDGEIVSFKKSLHISRALFYAGEKIQQNTNGSDNYLLWRFSTGPQLNSILEKVERKIGLTPNFTSQTMSLSAGVHAGPYLGGWGLIKFENS